MGTVYQPDIGESPLLFVTKTGELAVGMNCRLAELQIPSILKPAKALQDSGLKNRDLLAEDLIPNSDIQLALGSRDIRQLIDQLAQCPMVSAKVEVNFRSNPKGEFKLSRVSNVTLSEKKRMLEQEMGCLIRYAITIKAACGSQLRESELDNLYRSQFLAKTQPSRLIFTKDALDAQWQNHPTLGEEGASLVLDFIPIVGTVKAVAETVEGRDLLTGEKQNRWLLAGGVVLSFIPFGKLLEKVGGRVGGYVIKKLDKLTLSRRWDKLERGGAEGFNFTGKSTGINFRANNSGGSRGTFITDRTHIERAIGKVGGDEKTIEITREQALRLAKNLGVPEDSVLAGGTLSIISRVGERMPKKPVGGNALFKGVDKGLPGHGPELTIHPIPTAGGGGIKQINVRVKDLSNAEKKRLSRMITEELKKNNLKNQGPALSKSR